MDNNKNSASPNTTKQPINWDEVDYHLYKYTAQRLGYPVVAYLVWRQGIMVSQSGESPRRLGLPV